jgi:hypothetical protein
MYCNSLPVKIGFKKIDSINYPSRNIINLDFNKEKIISLLRKKSNLKGSIHDQAESYKAKMIDKMPFTFIFSREFEKDKEVFKIENVLDFEENDISKSIFSLDIQTLENDKGYWLDTGEFILNTRK